MCICYQGWTRPDCSVHEARALTAAPAVPRSVPTARTAPLGRAAVSAAIESLKRSLRRGPTWADPIHSGQRGTGSVGDGVGEGNAAGVDTVGVEWHII